MSDEIMRADAIRFKMSDEIMREPMQFGCQEKESSRSPSDEAGSNFQVGIRDGGWQRGWSVRLQRLIKAFQSRIHFRILLT
jgi:hypothetical protein